MSTGKQAALRERVRRHVRRPTREPGGTDRPFLRPTVGGIVAFLLAGALLIAGAGLLSTELVAAALACALALVCGLASTLLALALLKTAVRKMSSDRSTWKHAAARALRLVAAHPIARTSAWVRIDQRGRVKGSFTGGTPTARGLYRAGGRRVTFSDPFGFWLARASEPSRQELWVAPTPPAQTHPALSALTRQAVPYASADDATRMAALVRPYEKGDPLRTIAWRQSAHHGQLMSYDPERARPVVPLVAVDTLEVEDTDALAAEALGACLALARQAGARSDITLTDGTSRATGVRRIERFCAALDADDADNSAAIDTEAERRARAIARLAAQGLDTRNRRPVVLVARRADTALAHHLEEMLGTHLIVVIPRDAGEIAPAPGVDGEAPEATAQVPARGIKQHGDQAKSGTPLPIAVEGAVCCSAAIFLSLQLLGTMIEPASWSRFAGIALPAIALIATLAEGIPRIRRHHVRELINTLALVLVAVISISCAARVIAASSGIDVFDAASDLSSLDIDGTGGGLSWIAPVIARGLHELYFGQWVPVSVSPVSDAALTLLMFPAAVAVQLLCGARRLRPFMATLPLGLAAARVAFMGAANSAAEIAIILFCGLALRVLGQARPAVATTRTDDVTQLRAPQAVWRTLSAWRPLACVACLALALASCALAPAAMRASQGLPIRIDIQSNVLAGNTVSPIVDLRRDLTRSGETVALTYRTGLNRPLYLELATLSDLDGTTWELDSTQMDGAAGALSFLFPNDADAAPHALPGTDTADDLLTTLFRDDGMQAVGSIRSTASTIVIDGLASRFAPVPIGAFGTTVPRDSQTEGWRWSGTGTVYSESATTNRGLTYTAEAAYIEPVTNASELRTLAQDLELVLWSRLWSSGSVTTTEDWQALGGSVDELIEEGRESVDERYLELPDNLPESISGVVEELRVSSDSTTYGNEDLSQEIAQLEQLITYFSDNRFTYTLDVADAGDNLEAIARFLETGEGYCAHFASAFAVLGRALGIPTRIALGYRASTAQDSEGRYVVTNRDLHAWCEVYLYGIGWIPIDMTPASAQTSQSTDTPEATDTPEDTAQDEQNEPEATEQPTEDTESDADATVPDGQGAGSSGSTQPDPVAALRDFVAHALEALAHAVPYLGAALVLALLIFAPRILRALRRAGHFHAISLAEQAPARAIEGAWAEAQDLARRQGATWDRSATEEDIAHAVAKAIPHAADAVSHLAFLVCQARYGTAAPRTTADELRVQLEKIAASARTRSARAHASDRQTRDSNASAKR